VKRLFVLFTLLSSGVAGFSEETGFFPPAHQVFSPLLADQRELHYGLRAVLPVGHKNLGEAAIGDYFGIYHWDLEGDASLQVSVGGGVFGRFSLAAAGNDMQVADYYGNLPFDWHHHQWSGRFMLYHVSSHLGDDYLASHGGTTTKHAWDNLRWLTAYQASSKLRLYGGYTYVFRTLPAHLGRSALQGGFELFSPSWGQGHYQAYWANDFQSWQRTSWKPIFSSQVGIKIIQKPETRRAMSFFVEYMAGRQPHGQFFREEESRWNFGVRFDLT
jgi:hypothetical protein